jgi:hypothetical protein
MSEYFNSLVTDPAALLGLLASLIVLVSMCFNTRTKRGERLMRSLNFLGSIMSVVYGIVLGPAGFGMILLNGTLVFVNLFYLIKDDKNS